MTAPHALCPVCQRPLTDGESCSYCADKAVLRLMRREVGLLLLLVLIAIPMYAFTRTMAAQNRDMNVAAAAVWYARGETQLKAGQTALALESLHRASSNDHDNPQLTMALASALASAGRTAEAQQALLRLREASPEDGEVNLGLARLAASRQQVDEAKRYYHNALYGVWPAAEMEAQRRSVRMDLIRFLLTRGDTSGAISELLIYSADLPDVPASHIETGKLFLQALEPRRALDHFLMALKKEPENADALSGAGEAYFDLEDYVHARRYLENVPERATLLEKASLVLANDPLGNGLTTGERIRRLNDDLKQAANRMRSCGGDSDLSQEADSTIKELESSRSAIDPDALRDGLHLAVRMESATSHDCIGPSTTDEAIILIARKHGAVEQ